MKTIQDCVKHSIEVLNSEYSNTIPIFGGAIWVYHNNNFNSDIFISNLSHVAKTAEFFKWHEGVVGALHRFCNICMVDPMIVEAKIGMRFEELCAKA